MITKNDCMSILVKLEDTGLDVNKQIRALMMSKDIPLEVLRFISANRGIEISNFYEMLRKRSNEHKSPLYRNIMQGAEDEADAVVMLTSLLTQIELYGKRLDGTTSFYREARAEEIAKILHDYFTTEDATDIINLLGLIKSDIMVLEYIAGRRDLQ